jgi:hypothetical protein
MLSFYRPETQALEIIRVLNGLRDLKRLLNPDKREQLVHELRPLFLRAARRSDR